MDDSDESLLLRWSRRKHQARQSKPPEPQVLAAAPAEEGPVVPPSATAEMVSNEPAAETQAAEGEPAVRAEDLPDIETLTYDSDFSVFMGKGVPELLRKQALRKLWLSNPVLANLDGLNDYDPKSMTFLIQDMEGAVEGVAEIGRGLRDKIMDAKRARDDRPRGPRRKRPPHTRPGAPPPARTDVAEPLPTQDETETAAAKHCEDAAPGESKRYDA